MCFQGPHIHSTLTVVVREQVCGTNALVHIDLSPAVVQADLLLHCRISGHIFTMLLPNPLAALQRIPSLFSLIPLQQDTLGKHLPSPCELCTGEQTCWQLAASGWHVHWGETALSPGTHYSVPSVSLSMDLYEHYNFCIPVIFVAR